jgi:hypothetical protein
MKIIKYSIASVLIGFGIIVLASGVYSLFDEEAPNPSTFVACTVFGLPPTAGGIWLWRATQKQSKPSKKEQLAMEQKRRQEVLYQLIQEKEGRFTLLEFAMAAELPGEEARDFLQAQAQAFGANFDVNEQGDIVYRFLPG